MVKDIIIIAIIQFIAFVSGGYRMDEQYFVASHLSKNHRLRLNKNQKKWFLLKNKSTRTHFLTIAVIQHLIAYFMLLANIMVLLLVKRQNHLWAIWEINRYFIGVDGLLVVLFGIFYKLTDRKRPDLKSSLN